MKQLTALHNVFACFTNEREIGGYSVPALEEMVSDHFADGNEVLACDLSRCQLAPSALTYQAGL